MESAGSLPFLFSTTQGTAAQPGNGTIASLFGGLNNATNSPQAQAFSEILSKQQASAFLPSAASNVVFPAVTKVNGLQTSVDGKWLSGGLTGNSSGKLLPVEGNLVPIEAEAFIEATTEVLVSESVDPEAVLAQFSGGHVIEADKAESAGLIFQQAQPSTANLTQTANSAGSDKSQPGLNQAVPKHTPAQQTQTVTEESLAGLKNRLEENFTNTTNPQATNSPGVQTVATNNSFLQSQANQIPVMEGLKQAFIVQPMEGEPAETFAKQLNEAGQPPIKGLENALQHVNPAAASRLESLLGYRDAASPSWQAEVPATVGKQGWGDAVMQRVMWMSSQQMQTAEIALDPPELGPLQVRVSNQGEQTSVVFTSQHAQVREALDQSLPRLREMMEEQGVDLADVDVSDQGLHGQEQSAEGDEAQMLAAGEDQQSQLHEENEEEPTIIATSDRFIDEVV